MKEGDQARARERDPGQPPSAPHRQARADQGQTAHPRAPCARPPSPDASRCHADVGAARRPNRPGKNGRPQYQKADRPSWTRPFPCWSRPDINTAHARRVPAAAPSQPRPLRRSAAREEDFQEGRARVVWWRTSTDATSGRQPSSSATLIRPLPPIKRQLPTSQNRRPPWPTTGQ